MISDARQEALAEVAAMAPEVRLGQLMAHLGFLGEDQVERSLWDLEDEAMLAVLQRHRSELLARDPGVAVESLSRPRRTGRRDPLR